MDTVGGGLRSSCPFFVKAWAQLQGWPFRNHWEDFKLKHTRLNANTSFGLSILLMTARTFAIRRTR